VQSRFIDRIYYVCIRIAKPKTKHDLGAVYGCKVIETMQQVLVVIICAIFSCPLPAATKIGNLLHQSRSLIFAEESVRCHKLL
jgi:hypothetical protein